MTEQLPEIELGQAQELPIEPPAYVLVDEQRSGETWLASPTDPGKELSDDEKAVNRRSAEIIARGLHTWRKHMEKLDQLDKAKQQPQDKKENK